MTTSNDDGRKPTDKPKEKPAPPPVVFVKDSDPKKRK